MLEYKVITGSATLHNTGFDTFSLESWRTSCQLMLDD